MRCAATALVKSGACPQLGHLDIWYSIGFGMITNQSNTNQHMLSQCCCVLLTQCGCVLLVVLQVYRAGCLQLPVGPCGRTAEQAPLLEDICDMLGFYWFLSSQYLLYFLLVQSKTAGLC